MRVESGTFFLPDVTRTDEAFDTPLGRHIAIVPTIKDTNFEYPPLPYNEITLGAPTR